MLEARDVRMGMYAHSNQPSHHLTYMYDFAGQPSKTQALVREVLQRLGYVRGLKVNGKSWDKTYLPHDLLAAGGRLEVDMTDQPTSWGTGADAGPPSLTKPGEQPMSWQDSTHDTGAVVSSVDGDVAGLVDDDSRTAVALTGANPSVNVQLTEPASPKADPRGPASVLGNRV